MSSSRLMAVVEVAPRCAPANLTRMLSLRPAGDGDGTAQHAGSLVKVIVVAPRGQ
jgi:hypothetical protein